MPTNQDTLTLADRPMSASLYGDPIHRLPQQRSLPPSAMNFFAAASMFLGSVYGAGVATYSDDVILYPLPASSVTLDQWVELTTLPVNKVTFRLKGRVVSRAKASFRSAFADETVLG